MGICLRVRGTVFCAAVLVVVISSITAFGVLRTGYRFASAEICDLIEENYYRAQDLKVRDWVARCREQAARETFILSKAKHIERINDRLAALNVSHLTLYSPVENRMIWENEGLDTGIRSRMIDAYLVVTEVLPQSPAEAVGLKAGDVLVGLNGQLIGSAYDAQTGEGTFVVSRDDHELAFEIEPEELIEDLSPKLRRINADVGVLRIPSFLAQYFGDAEWTELSSQLGRYRRLVIDLRSNAGGSFPAMLRALSPFRCGAPLVGEVYHGRGGGRALKGTTDLKNDLDTHSQLEQLHSAEVVRLRTFQDYGCYTGDVTVLMDSDTSSVAEIFAQAFYSRPRSRVWGHPSAGQVVMAQWFPVSILGGDEYSVSIPIAGYRTADGLELESQGLYPQRTLHYDLDLALEGRDSWLEEAIRPFPAGGADKRTVKVVAPE